MLTQLCFFWRCFRHDWSLTIDVMETHLDAGCPRCHWLSSQINPNPINDLKN